MRSWLYGVHFILETDINVLAAQLNRSGTDLPGALITRWLAWIRFFDFEVRHIPGTKHTAADGLSRRPRTASDDIDEENAEDIDDFIDAQLNSIRVFPIDVDPVLEGEYSEQSWKIAQYLATLQRPSDMDRKEFRSFQQRALKYQVIHRQLFRRASKNVSVRRVIDSEEDRRHILQEMYNESGHRGREGTYRRIADRY